MGKLNSDGHYICYYGQNSLRKNGVVLIVNKRAQNTVLGCSLKNDKVIFFFHFQGKSFNITVIQVYAHSTNAEEEEVEWFYEELQDFLELTHTHTRTHTHTDVFFFIIFKSKTRMSKDTWSNRWVWPWSTKWSRAKANRVLSEEHTGHSKHSLPTMQEMTTHGHLQMVNTKIRLILFSAVEDGEVVYSQNKIQSWLRLGSSVPYCKI